MQLYSSSSHSDEESSAIPSKQAIIIGSKSELIALCEFFEQIKIEVSENKSCHMQFRDFLSGWKRTDIDIEVNLNEN